MVPKRPKWGPNGPRRAPRAPPTDARTGPTVIASVGGPLWGIPGTRLAPIGAILEASSALLGSSWGPPR
eukprot:1432515-Pyramimonas_sp.AAC.1